MQKLALRTWEWARFGMFQGLPLEDCEYKELMDFFKELWEYLLELAAKAMEAMAQMLKNISQEVSVVMEGSV